MLPNGIEDSCIDWSSAEALAAVRSEHSERKRHEVTTDMAAIDLAAPLAPSQEDYAARQPVGDEFRASRAKSSASNAQSAVNSHGVRICSEAASGSTSVTDGILAQIQAMREGRFPPSPFTRSNIDQRELWSHHQDQEESECDIDDCSDCSYASTDHLRFVN